MRLHRFHISEQVGGRSELAVNSEELAGQLGKVFRLRAGAHVSVFDGSGSDYECEIAEMDKKSVRLRVISVAPSRYMPARTLYLCAAVVKKDNFEFIAEKATELGVTDIIPVLAERTEKKALNEERLKKIAIEASEQSGRGDVPAIHGIVSLDACIHEIQVLNMPIVVFHTEGPAFKEEEIAQDKPIAVFIGPEGGWSPAEIELFHASGVLIRCLGPQVLRAETAVIAALSRVVFGG